jgi:hypothetical protein
MGELGRDWLRGVVVFVFCVLLPSCSPMYGASLELSEKEKVGMMPWTLDAPPGTEGEEGTLDPLGYVFNHDSCASTDRQCDTVHLASAATHGGFGCSHLLSVSAVLDPELCTLCDAGKPCASHSLSPLPRHAVAAFVCIHLYLCARACLWVCPRGFIVWLRALQHQSHVPNAWGRGQWGRQRIRDVLWIRQPGVAWEVSAPPSSVHHATVTQGA